MAQSVEPNIADLANGWLRAYVIFPFLVTLKSRDFI